MKSPHDVGETLVDFLRALYPRKTAESVSADLAGLGKGVAASTVAKWLERASVPAGETVLDLIALYGPGFLRVVAPGLPWVDDAAKQQRRAELHAAQAALEAEIAALVSGEDEA